MFTDLPRITLADKLANFFNINVEAIFFKSSIPPRPLQQGLVTDKELHRSA